MATIGTLAVMAGGRSERMGRDKALVVVGGMTMLERVVRAGLAAGLEVVVVGREGVEGWPAELKGVRFLADRGEAFSGPIGGVVTALEEVGSVAVVGCDMPLVDAELLRAMVAAHEGSGKMATMALREEVEPMLAVYEVGMLGRLKEWMAAGRRSLFRLAGEEGVGTWRVPGEMAWRVLNVNDAAGVAEAERSLVRFKSM